MLLTVLLTNWQLVLPEAEEWTSGEPDSYPLYDGNVFFSKVTFALLHFPFDVSHIKRALDSEWKYSKYLPWFKVFCVSFFFFFLPLVVLWNSFVWVPDLFERLRKISFKMLMHPSYLLDLKDTHTMFLVSNTECKHNFYLFTRKPHRGPLTVRVRLIIQYRAQEEDLRLDLEAPLWLSKRTTSTAFIINRLFASFRSSYCSFVPKIPSSSFTNCLNCCHLLTLPVSHCKNKPFGLWSQLIPTTSFASPRQHQEQQGLFKRGRVALWKEIMCMCVLL